MMAKLDLRALGSQLAQRAKAVADRVRSFAPVRFVLDRLTLEEILAAGVVIFVIHAMVRRMRYGVDATDEAFYCSLTHRFALGDWPYADDVNLRQTSGLFAMPIYWAYVKIRGDTDGVILLLRGLYLAITCGVGYTIYAYAREKIGRALALLVAVTPVAFFPFGLWTCSYNNLGCMLFTAGTFVALRAAAQESARTHRLQYTAGVVHGLALVAMPTYIIPIGALGVLQLVAVRDDRWKRTLRYFIGGGVVAAVIGLMILKGGRVAIHEAFAYEHAQQAIFPQPNKLAGVINDMQARAPGQPAALATIFGWLAVAKLWPTFRRWGTLALLPLLAWIYSPMTPPPPTPDTLDLSTVTTAASGLEQHVRPLYYMMYVCLAALVVLPLMPRGPDRRELSMIGWIPALFASLTTGYGSANSGAINAGMGAFCGALVTVVALALAIGKRPPSLDRPELPVIVNALLFLAVLTVPLLNVRFARAIVYRDGPLETLTTPVTTGPYRGLYTTPENDARMSTMVRKLRQLERPEGKVLVLYDYPAAYIMTLMRPAMPTVWNDSRMAISDYLLHRYKHNITGQGFVVRMQMVDNHADTRIGPIIEAPERLEFTDQYFKIYAEPDPTIIPVP
jgi:hypothetical protein